MENVLILGYGNPLCGDDGAGRRVVEALADLLPEGVAFALHQLTPEWAEPISRTESVIFIDAAMGAHPGEVRCFPISAAPGRAGSHSTTPDGLLAMAAELFGRCPPATMVTITGGSFEIAETMTGAVEVAVPEVVSRIMSIVGQVSAK